MYSNSLLACPDLTGNPVAQWVKRLPADLAIPYRFPEAEIFSIVDWSSVALSLSISSFVLFDMTEILLEGT